jgi:hypothetical protein
VGSLLALFTAGGLTSRHLEGGAACTTLGYGAGKRFEFAISLVVLGITLIVVAARRKRQSATLHATRALPPPPFAFTPPPPRAPTAGGQNCVPCGASLSDGAKFCLSCGTPVVASPIEHD